MTFNDIIENTREHAELKSVKPSEVSVEVTSLVERWEIELSEGDRRQRTSNELLFAYHMFDWLKSDVKLTKPVILACPPGYGKSTALRMFLYNEVRANPKFGAIVVKEKLEDLWTLADYINGDNGRYACYIEGSNKFETREQYELQFAMQEQFPIVLMTMEQLRLQTVKKWVKHVQKICNVGDNS